MFYENEPRAAEATANQEEGENNSRLLNSTHVHRVPPPPPLPASSGGRAGLVRFSSGEGLIWVIEFPGLCSVALFCWFITILSPSWIVAEGGD